MGFWVKNQNENHYLYLRYSQYIRDRRTLKRKARSKGEGDSNSNKYIKRKDLYLGKLITLKKPKQIFFFEDYLHSINISNKLKFLYTNSYDKIFEVYLDYLFKLYDIDKLNFFRDDKLIVYETTNGYLSKRILDWFHSFNIKPKQAQGENEVKRFTFRCEFIGILDIEIISILYQKFVQ